MPWWVLRCDSGKFTPAAAAMCKTQSRETSLDAIIKGKVLDGEKPQVSARGQAELERHLEVLVPNQCASRSPTPPSDSSFFSQIFFLVRPLEVALHSLWVGYLAKLPASLSNIPGITQLKDDTVGIHTFVWFWVWSSFYQMLCVTTTRGSSAIKKWVSSRLDLACRNFPQIYSTLSTSLGCSSWTFQAASCDKITKSFFYWCLSNHHHLPWKMD